MSYTPVELRHVKVSRSLFGYNRATVEQLIEEVAQSFEATWRERGELADKVESLEKQLDALRSREELLTQTLVAAEQAASDVRERARREAEAIVAEAHSEARARGRAAHVERERLVLESRRIEGMLRAALGIIEGAGSSPVEQHVVPPAPAVPVPPATEDDYGWEREDTREFVPITTSEPVAERPVEHESEPEPVAVGETLAEPEPEHAEEHPVVDDAAIDAVAEPLLEPIRGGGSRDFDWGE
jgi:hypothetical protein